MFSDKRNGKSKISNACTIPQIKAQLGAMHCIHTIMSTVYRANICSSESQHKFSPNRRRAMRRTTLAST
jgi:hypothetical protein